VRVMRASMLETLEDAGEIAGTDARVAARPEQGERPKLCARLGSIERSESRGGLSAAGAMPTGIRLRGGT
jgi:hypothetical protein